MIARWVTVGRCICTYPCQFFHVMSEVYTKMDAALKQPDSWQRHPYDSASFVVLMFHPKVKQ